MSPDTEVVACPACQHLVRVPADLLGQTVRCPECRAAFTAPTRAGGALTPPTLIAAPPAAAPAPRRADLLLTFPAFGLMLVGVVGLVVNGTFAVRFGLHPDAARAEVGARIAAMREAGFGADEPEAEREQRDADRAARAAPVLRGVFPVLAVIGGVVFAGGLAIVRRKGYRLARAGCVLAAVALPQLCCVPGAVVGVWGLLMLMSAEGREHFAGRATV